MKVKDIKKFLLEIYNEDMFTLLDIPEFVKSEVENKGIIVIDEIDKLVKTVKSYLYKII